LVIARRLAWTSASAKAPARLSITVAKLAASCTLGRSLTSARTS